jgi:hypothetical protein
MGGAGDRPEATFVAVADARAVGYAKFSLNSAQPTVAFHDLTGVRRDWRGRGTQAPSSVRRSRGPRSKATSGCKRKTRRATSRSGASTSGSAIASSPAGFSSSVRSPAILWSGRHTHRPLDGPDAHEAIGDLPATASSGERSPDFYDLGVVLTQRALGLPTLFSPGHRGENVLDAHCQSVAAPAPTAPKRTTALSACTPPAWRDPAAVAGDRYRLCRRRARLTYRNT